MKIYKSCLLVVVLLATTSMCLIAQDVTLPEYDAARAWTPDKNEQKTFSLSIHPNYFKGSTRFWYSFKTSQGENVYVVDPATRTKRVLFSTEDIASQISSQSEQKYTAQQLPIKDLKLKDDNVTFEFTVDSVKYEYQYTQQKLTNLGKEKKDRPAQRFGNISPDKQWVVYAKNYNLYMMSNADYERIQKKTADFLEICCELGGIVGGLPEEDTKKLAEYGHCIGMAFQITDDVLDIMQTSEQIVSIYL